MRDTEPGKMAETLQENIATLAARERGDAARAGWSDRLADRVTRFTGSMVFVALHFLLYGSWIVVNLGWVPGVKPFDPSFVILAMEASVEAIFLSTFVLISQNRMAAAAERRAALDLHVSLLAEHELTKLAGMVERIAARLDVTVDESAVREIVKDVDPERVLDALDAERDRHDG